MKAALSLILGLALGAAAAWMGQRYFAPPPNTRTPTPQGNPSQSQQVVALGRIVPANGVIEIGGMPTELIEKIEVEEGHSVKKDAILATLGSYELLEKKIEGLRAKLAEAKEQADAEQQLIDAQIRQAEVAAEESQLSNFDVAAQEEQIQLLIDNHELANSEWEQLKTAPDSLVSDQDRKRQELAVKKAEAEVAAAQSNLKKLKLAQDLAKKTAEAQIAMLEKTRARVKAQLPTDSLDAEIKALQAQQRQSQVRAPVDGQILDISAHPGELIGNRRILRMADLSTMAVIAEVYEASKKDVKDKQAVTITGPAIKGALRGHVHNISPIIAKPNVPSVDPFAPADRRVFEVKILLDEASQDLARGLVNAPVDIEFGEPATSTDTPVPSPKKPAGSP